ncbi:MAG TPA: nucleoside hydrolase-like domain-containing protein, partial [Gemmatimonadaceae bacterium]|nr:nucleoside hydrolase-like domain-containing protein [Gemmatimonadaceae bacterium]
SVYYSSEWTRQNISSRGAFGALYRVWGDGKQMVHGDRFDYFGLSGLTSAELRAKGYVVWLPPRPKGEFLGEGDTFTYFNLIGNGLDAYRDETPGGWAGHVTVNPTSSGRTAQSAPAMSFEAFMKSLEGIGPEGPATRPPSPQPNFTAAAQNDFATRMKWSVTPTYASANHEPTVDIRGSARVSARPGETVRLQGAGSDSDGNAVAVRWWRWKDVDTYPGEVSLLNPTALTTTLRVPDDAAPGQRIQLVLEATDNGTPALTRYRRVVVAVVPTATAQTPRLELDHVYMVVQPGGVKEIDALKSAGFYIAPPQKHDGEGTTSVAALFDNAYLELMWLDSTLSITADHAAAAQQFRDAAAWKTSRHSPFGIGLRRLPGETGSFAFPIKRESAPWIDADAAYEILNQPADSLAVDLFVVPPGAAVPNWIEGLRKRRPQFLNHPGGGHEITAVRIHGTVQQQASTLALVRPARIETRTAAEPFLEVYIDGGVKKSRTDLRPTLPIVVIR